MASIQQPYDLGEQITSNMGGHERTIKLFFMD